jgi:hypothetical protein
MSDGAEGLGWILEMLAWAVVAAVLVGVVRLVRRPGVRRELASDGGYGFLAGAFALAGFAAMNWAGSLSGFAGWNALLAVLGVLAGLLVLVPLGVLTLARPQNRDRRGAVLVFLVLAAAPVVPLVVFLLSE